MNMVTQIRHNMNHFLIPQKINVALTKKVIALHERGYTLDFSVTADYRLLCVQDERLFKVDEVVISLIDQCFDEITSCYKYFHTVETGCGIKGLLVDCSPCVNSLLAVKFLLSPLGRVLPESPISFLK